MAFGSSLWMTAENRSEGGESRFAGYPAPDTLQHEQWYCNGRLYGLRRAHDEAVGDQKIRRTTREKLPIECEIFRCKPRKFVRLEGSLFGYRRLPYCDRSRMASLCGAVLAYRFPDMKHYDPARKTIADFGEQWTTYVDNEGHYGSREYFFDIVSPLLTPEQVNGASVADIGSGTGRIVLMLLDAGAQIVHAVEPSDALDVVKQNTQSLADRIVYHHIRGDELPNGLDLDLVVSIGVIHHIPEPQPVMCAAFNTLKPGGRCVVWLYGHEGNETYLAIFGPLRRITARMPHWMLAGLCHLLTVAASGYAWLCRWLKLPLANYMRRVFATLSWHKRFLVIYDQLNPAYAKYYTRDEARALFVEAGFTDIALHHRHGYSWTVMGRKP